MKQMLLSLIGIALLQSVCTLLTNDEKHKTILRLAGGIAMVTLLLSSLRSFDYDAYASSLRTSLQATELGDAALKERRKLNRTLIEQECRAYILDKAEALGADLKEASVTLSWNTDGYWYPSAAELKVSENGAYHSGLADVIQTDLGIPLSAQVWREEEGIEP